MKEKIIKSSKEYIILLFITILVCLPFFVTDKYIEGNDTHYHMSNIYSMYTRMEDGSFGNEKVFPIIANDYGYGSGIFYPQLSHVIPAFFTFLLHGNVVLAVKILHFIVYYISAIMMFKLVNKIFKNRYVAMIAAIFYITFPYAITDVFTRDALAESFVFMFMPMIIMGLYELFEGSKRRFYAWFIAGYVGMINSHLVMTLYFTIFVFIYLLIYIKRVFSRKRFGSLVLASLLIILITLPFTASLIEHRFIGEYAVFNGETMTHSGLVRSATFFPWEFFIQKSTDRYQSIKQYLNLLAVALTIVTIVKRKEIFKTDSEKKFYKMLWLFAVLALVFMTFWPWEIMPKFMIMIQYAWRIETMLVFALSILAALALRNLEKTKLKVICLTVIVVFNMLTVSYSYMKDMFIDYDINNVDMSNLGMGWDKEYLPVRVVENMDYYNNRGNDVLIRRGYATIENVNSNTPDLDFEVTNNPRSVVIEIPRIYYLGYNITFTDTQNQTEEVRPYMNENGFVEIKVPGNGKVQVRYTGTQFEKVCNRIAIVVVAGIVLYIVIDKIRYIVYKKKNTPKMKLLPQ